jgi:hypothetical protein
MTRLRILIKMASADAFELKAQALNKDPRLAAAGISALKFTGDKNYIADGEFSPDLPPPTAPAPASAKTDLDSPIRPRLRVVVRMTSPDSYELKSQALNNDARLKDAGISALKFANEGQYIAEGEFSPDLPPASPSTPQAPAPEPDAKVRVVLRAPTEIAYEFIARHLNNDPELARLGISGVGLAKGAGMVPVAQESPAQQTPTPAPLPKKIGSFITPAVIAVIVALIVIGGASALFFSGPPEPIPTQTATEAAIIPVAGEPTDTPVPATETTVPPTSTKVISTKTKAPTAPSTSSPTPTVLACLPPSEVVVFAENLSCRYGPGAVYLYRTGLVKDMVVDVLGRADSAYGTWIRVQTRWEIPVQCWVNSGPNFVEIPHGDVACLEPLYPEKAPLIIYNTDLFPKPSNVEASRSGNLVFIAWNGHDLLPGDKPVASMRYLVETWTCQDGEIVFTPQGTDETYAQVRDDGGCAEASHGYVYLAHVDGYIGPVTIPWPE